MVKSSFIDIITTTIFVFTKATRNIYKQIKTITDGSLQEYHQA